MPRARARRSTRHASSSSSSRRPWPRRRRSGAAVLAPPSWPAVIWNAIGIDALAPDADQPSAVEHTTTVGCQMLAGALAPHWRRGARRQHRAGRHGGHRAAAPRDRGRVARRGAARPRASCASAGLPSATSTWSATPMTWRCSEPGSSTSSRPSSRRRSTPRRPRMPSRCWPRSPSSACAGPPGSSPRRVPGSPTRSARCSTATTRSRRAPTASGPLLRANERIGIPACLAGARETARGRPVSCTGDIPAALALWLGRRLTGAALYTEWYLSQPGDGDALLLSCGLADLAFGRAGSASLYEVSAVPGVRGNASGVRFAARTGPVDPDRHVRRGGRLAARVARGRERRRGVSRAARRGRALPARERSIR